MLSRVECVNGVNDDGWVQWRLPRVRGSMHQSAVRITANINTHNTTWQPFKPHHAIHRYFTDYSSQGWLGSRFAPSQWETALLCNAVSHWLGASLESALVALLRCIKDGAHIEMSLTRIMRHFPTTPVDAAVIAPSYSPHGRNGVKLLSRLLWSHDPMKPLDVPNMHLTGHGQHEKLAHVHAAWNYTR